MASKPTQLNDKNGVPIHVGDMVSNRARGGKQVGIVSSIITDEKQAEEKGVGHAPKVLFTDQHGHHISHYPDVLVHGADPFEG